MRKEQRKNVRYQTLAKARIEGIDEGEILLKDISIIGCRVECTAPVKIDIDKQYKLEVIPENKSEIGVFDLLVEAKWIHAHEMGFSIVETPKGKSFQRYADYLSWRFSHGDSMSGNSETPGAS